MTRYVSSPRGVQQPLFKQERRGDVILALPEEDVQKAIVTGLRMYHYRVWVTSRVRKRTCCGSCGAWSFAAGGDGVDKGLADLIVRNPKWPKAVCVSLEVKGEKTPLSEEQKQELADGEIVVVRSFEEALAAVMATDVELGTGGPR